MAGNATNTLVANIISTDDTTQNVPINFGTGSPAFDSTSLEFMRYFVLTGGVQNFAPPKSPATMVYIKNTDLAKTISVSWTPNGGVNSTVVVLNPGDQIILWANPAGATTPGITSIQMQSSAAGCLVEFFFAG